jgi:predicted peptidase
MEEPAMNVLLAAAMTTLLGQAAPTVSGVHELRFQMPTGGTMLYAVSIPKGYDAQRPAPLVLVLHSGGERMRYYGSAFMRLLVEPALNGLRPIMIAPDCPTNAWTDPIAEQAVMALVQDTLAHYAIDRRRILVTGFSMGGRGTWFMASRHSDLFTGAIPMAASIGDEPMERLGIIPTYVIHSRADEVSPFAPAERAAKQLITLGRTVRFEPLDDFGHYEMFRYVDALRRAGRWMADRWGK